MLVRKDFQIYQGRGGHDEADGIVFSRYRGVFGQGEFVLGIIYHVVFRQYAVRFGQDICTAGQVGLEQQVLLRIYHIGHQIDQTVSDGIPVQLAAIVHFVLGIFGESFFGEINTVEGSDFFFSYFIDGRVELSCE